MAKSYRALQAEPASIQGPRIIVLLCVLALTLIGLVMVYSASSVTALNNGVTAESHVLDQVKYVIIGVVCAVILWRFIPYSVWRGNLVWIIWALSVGLLILTSIIGTSEYGAKRWLNLGLFSLQPSEFFKIAVLLMSVRIMDDLHKGVVDMRSALVQTCVCIVLPVVFMYGTQSDLGTTLIIVVGILAVMWLGGVPLKPLVAIIGTCFVLVLVAVLCTGYRSSRAAVFLDPWNDGQGGYGDGYHIIRSLYALAEGGLFGTGLGNSHEKYQYLFASDSDFIFSIIGEELGLIGTVVVIGLFIALLIAGMRIALQAPDLCGTMIAGGCVIMLVAQAFLNIGSSIGVLPTTGKPLPFISAGGSSMIATMIMIGLVLSVSRAETFAPSEADVRRANLQLIRATSPRRGIRDANTPRQEAFLSSARPHKATSKRSLGGNAYRPLNAQVIERTQFQNTRMFTFSAAQQKARDTSINRPIRQDFTHQNRAFKGRR